MDEKITFTRESLINVCTNVQDSLEREEMIVDAFLREFEEKTDAEEFRTPKKVLHDSREYADGRTLVAYGCPTCKTFLPHKGRKYCTECGQALDWSEVENGSEL